MALLVNIDVDDLEKGINFYCRGLGLRVGRRFGEFAAELLGLDAPLYLLVKPAGTSASPMSSQLRTYGRHWTPVHLDFVVDNIDTALQRVLAAGAVLERDTTTQVWGKLAVLADPFGHGICLIEFIGRGYDEIADAE